MSAAMEIMLDHFAIRQVLERYARGVDRLDEEMISSVYWPEATDNHGLYVGSGAAFGAWLIPRYREGYICTMHCLHQSNLHVAGNAAAGDTYFVCYQRARREGRIDIETSIGRYVDRFEKRGAEWRVIDRVVVMEHVQIEKDMEEADYKVADFTAGRRDREDLSYGAIACL